MVRRISFFICSCILIHWTGPGIGSKEPVSTVKPIYSSPNATILDSSDNASSVAPSPTTTVLPSNTSSVAPSPTTTALPSNTSSVAPSPTTTALPSNSITPSKQKPVTVNNWTATQSATLEPNIASHTTKQSPASPTTPATSAEISSEKRYVWILLPGLCIVVASIIYLKFKCKKVQHQPEMAENGTENASFQRTDSNKDGVMLLGVSKTSVGEDNATLK